MASDNQSKQIVITGGTRGIGFCMAQEFLKRGHRVTISGTKPETLQQALEKLRDFSDRVQGTICDVTKLEELEQLWAFAVKKWGRVDIWINNAGINQPHAPVWEVAPQRVQEIMATNVTGMIHGSQVALRGMTKQGQGAIYNMEGWGSDGAHMNNLNIYGTSKCALRYFTRGLIGETKSGPVIVGTLSPGMMVTDFILQPLREDPQRLARMKKMLNLIADKPENVAAFLVPNMLANQKHGAHFAWFTRAKFFRRMIKSIFVKRDLLKDVNL
ncbi:MAG TPA: SDR family oxidoreductase [Bacillota bacterium]|nr:SDR family oxidoreductase [Bacillota bacterium]